jgi:hypothetical protein
LAKIKSHAVQHLRSINIGDEYGTPITMYFDACRRFNIHPKIDVAASYIHHVTDMFLTIVDNFLKCNVVLDFFMNAPYSRQYEFMRHAYELHKKNNLNVLILAYSKTDTKWWHEFVEEKAEVHFIKGRVKFFIDGKLTKNSAPYPSCWIIYRRR